MNKLLIIGNLTADPELRTTTSGINVCTFSVAVNDKSKKEQETEYFRVSAWRGLADICKQYLAKGRKVCVIGSVHKHEYRTKNGDLGASLEVQAQDVEFLPSAAGQAESGVKSPENGIPERDPQTGYEKVNVDNELPF